MQQQQKVESIAQQAKQAFDVTHGVSQIIAYPVQAVTRWGFGCRYYRNPGAYIAAVVPWFWIGFFNGEPVPLLAALATLYPPAVLWHNWQARRATRRGIEVHSLDCGVSRFGRYENAVVLLAGALGVILSPAFGTYLVAAAVCMAMNNDVMRWRDRAVNQAMIDAKLEQEHYRRMRDAHGQ